jgi:RNase H-like domain found in reverse transcriptase
MLAILFSLERFHTYIYARADVTVETDHKPLISIHKNALSAAAKRLQQMLLRTQRYANKLEFRPGSQMVLADTLSRRK